MEYQPQLEMSYNTPREVLSEHKAKVVVSTTLLKQIKYLHEHCPRNTEWSGLLIWKLVNGSINDLANVEIQAEAVFPMDYGDASFTSFEGNADWITAFQQFPQIDPIMPQEGWYVGKIHSHHNMSVYHSQTDKNDLYENASKLPLFLSLIANYSGEFDCELAISMEVEKTMLERVSWKLKGWSKKKKKIEKKTDENKMVYLLKCEVNKESEPMDEWMVNQCNALKAKPKATPVYGGYNYNGNTGYAGTTYGTENKKTTVIDVARTFVVTKAREHFVDLISLGEMYTDSSTFTALSKINDALPAADKEKYQKALKMYFMEYWFPSVFFKMENVDEDEVMTALLDVMKYQQSNWTLAAVKQAINELKEEYPRLWEVQESSLV